MGKILDTVQRTLLVSVVVAAIAGGGFMAVRSLVFVDLEGGRIVSECGHCGSRSISFTKGYESVYCWSCKKITPR